jgi:hypothetical protein
MLGKKIKGWLLLQFSFIGDVTYSWLSLRWTIHPKVAFDSLLS